MTETISQIGDAAADSGDAMPEILTVAEIVERYRDEWVMLRATEHDDYGEPSRGYIVAHAMRQDDALTQLERRTRLPLDSEYPLHQILADPCILSSRDHDIALILRWLRWRGRSGE